MLGIINIDKPSGCTSHDVISFVRLLAGRKVKVGHSGTLDPMATGVLPVFVGKATRLIQYISSDDKAYRFKVDFSFTTDSADLDGKVVERFTPDSIPSFDDVKDAAHRFCGDIKQMAPMYSAVSIGGTRLYKLAREGKTVSRPLRDVHISSLTLVDYTYPVAEFTVSCSRGTYVRVLAEDIGKALSLGGTVISLRRTFSGGLSEETALTPFQLVRNYVSDGLQSSFVSFESIFSDCSVAICGDKTLSKVTNGMKITEEEIEYTRKVEDSLRVFLIHRGQQRLVALYQRQSDSGLLAAEKVLY